MPPAEREHDEAIAVAAEWLSTSPRDTGRPIIPALRERFGLTAKEAIDVLREANLRRARAA